MGSPFMAATAFSSSAFFLFAFSSSSASAFSAAFLAAASARMRRRSSRRRRRSSFSFSSSSSSASCLNCAYQSVGLDAAVAARGFISRDGGTTSLTMSVAGVFRLAYLATASSCARNPGILTPTRFCSCRASLPTPTTTVSASMRNAARSSRTMPSSPLSPAFCSASFSFLKSSRLSSIEVSMIPITRFNMIMAETSMNTVKNNAVMTPPAEGLVHWRVE
mmetsp:Transcript_41509/g.97353  ORF Transcript_41509/g.97353 Transcript_41509/m.97353 type:complete len:220 (+) Transcript_41509:337-996(+)